ncbi:unnamed protein product [Moneuplotes crassus]|uniref:Uncharacterized protein n=1 Tax=Euplotes crassus TaxID=5936 RepID=A0AAD1Y3A9_EUPCR|nr:unnamed protein product [Moneuplotes crassus]
MKHMIPRMDQFHCQDTCSQHADICHPNGDVKKDLYITETMNQLSNYQHGNHCFSFSNTNLVADTCSYHKKERTLGLSITTKNIDDSTNDEIRSEQLRCETNTASIDRTESDQSTSQTQEVPVVTQKLKLYQTIQDHLKVECSTQMETELDISSNRSSGGDGSYLTIVIERVNEILSNCSIQNLAFKYKKKHQKSHDNMYCLEITKSFMLRQLPGELDSQEELQLYTVKDCCHEIDPNPYHQLIINHFSPHLSKMEQIMIGISRAIKALEYFENDSENFFDSETIACLVS